MEPRGTCSRCGVSLFGDGDIGTQHAGRFTCTVCLFDFERLRDFAEREGWNMEMLETTIRDSKPKFDEIRGRELRRRATRETGT